MICTVQISTRLRHERLKKTIKSVLDTASHPENIEFILRCDFDDIATLNALPEIIPMGNIKVIVGKPLTYIGYSINHWDMGQIAVGDWLWYFDDDATMDECSKGWDEKLALMPKTGTIVLPEWNRLGGSSYHENLTHPFMFLPNGWWKSYGITKFAEPCDDFIFRTLRGKYKWETVYLEGVSTWHQREINDALNKEQNRF